MSAVDPTPACSEATVASIPRRSPNVGAWLRLHRPPSIQKISPMVVEILVTEADGVKFDGPNHLAFGPDGRLYFHRFGHWAPDTKPHPGRIVVIAKTGKASVLEELDHVYPNGIVVEPDGSVVWVESYTLKVVRRRPDGAKQVIHTMPEGHIPVFVSTPQATSGSRRSPPAASMSSTRTASHCISSIPAARYSTACSARGACSIAATWGRSTSPARR